MQESGGVGGAGKVLVFADEADEGLRRTRQAGIAPVDEAEFAEKNHAVDAEQLHLPSFHLIFGKAFADEGNPGVGADEALDHTDAGQLHGDMDTRAIRPEKFVENLASEAGTGKNQRLASNFFEGNLTATGQGILGADHKTHAVF